MNQEKVGKFIAQLRKEKGMTQESLAQHLGISDRAVSKWERGLNLPDASLMLELSNLFDITINELFSGEIIEKNDYMKNAEINLIELQKQNEELSKKMLLLEYFIGAISVLVLLSSIRISLLVEVDNILRIVILIVGIVTFAIGMYFSTIIEQKAGYYECGKCHHKYIPIFMAVLFAPHINRTRYLKCPECNKKSWNKKVIK